MKFSILLSLGVFLATNAFALPSRTNRTATRTLQAGTTQGPVKQNSPIILEHSNPTEAKCKSWSNNHTFVSTSNVEYCKKQYNITCDDAGM